MLAALWKRVLNMINDLPTVFEVLSGAAKKQQVKDEVDEEEEEEEDGEIVCAACGENYGSGGEFWICCDICERWFHGKCVKITPATAERIKQYKCPFCAYITPPSSSTF